MEIEGENGSKTQLKKGLKTELGRGLGFDSEDRTVSRRHVSFEPKNTGRVHFEVIGRNPIWVKSSRSDEIRVFRRWEGGEIEDGDMFCVSAKKPIWFAAKILELGEGEDERAAGNERELDEGIESGCGLRSVGDLGLDSGDVSGIDPVKGLLLNWIHSCVAFLLYIGELM